MTVTENDILNNAAQIAILVNSISGIQVGDLPTKASPAADDFVHVSEKTTKDDYKSESQNVGGGGSTPDWMIDFPAAWDYPAADFADWLKDTGSNGVIFSNEFDAATDKSVLGQFVLPSGLDTSENMYFEALCFSDAASPSGNAKMAIVISKSTPGSGDWDSVFGTPILSDAVDFDTQNRLEIINWSETLATIGAVAGDLVRIRLFFDVSESTMADNLKLPHFRIRIPRS